MQVQRVHGYCAYCGAVKIVQLLPKVSEPRHTCEHK